VGTGLFGRFARWLESLAGVREGRSSALQAKRPDSAPPASTVPSATALAEMIDERVSRLLSTELARRLPQPTFGKQELDIFSTIFRDHYYPVIMDEVRREVRKRVAEEVVIQLATREEREREIERLEAQLLALKGGQ
jgi:hypothetical protein